MMGQVMAWSTESITAWRSRSASHGVTSGGVITRQLATPIRNTWFLLKVLDGEAYKLKFGNNLYMTLAMLIRTTSVQSSMDLIDQHRLTNSVWGSVGPGLSNVSCDFTCGTYIGR